MDSLEEIFGFLDAFFADERIGAGTRFAVKLSVEELFTNMVKYGASRARDVLIDLERLDDRVAVSLTEFDTEPFDIRKLEEVRVDRPIEERNPGGLGIHLIKKMMDRIDYEYVDRRSRTTLVKKLE